MVVAKPRRFNSSAKQTSSTSPSKSTNRIQILIPCENLDAYNENVGSDSNIQEQHNDENSNHQKVDNPNPSHHSSQTSTTTTTTTTQSKHGDSSLTRSHLRSVTRRRSTKRGVTTRARASRNSGFFSDGEDDEIEEPRLQHHLESVVSAEQPWSTKGFDIFKEVAGRAQKGQNKQVYKTIFSSTSLDDNTSSTTGTAEPELSIVDEPLMDNSKPTQQKWEREQSAHDDLDDQSSLMFSRLSLTPPPMMFDLEEGFESMETPWQMVFDSSRSFNTLDPNPRIKIAELTNADLTSADKEHGQESDMPDIDNDGYDEEDDDPFGFSKVERQLVRTKNQRPKLLAINEINHRFSMTTKNFSGNNSVASNSIKNSPTRRFDSTPSRNVQERLAARRRGDIKNKGKAVDYDNNGSSSMSVLDVKGNNDEDLQKAIQLSRGLDYESGEGCSTATAPLSTSMSVSSKETLIDEPDSTTLTEPSSTQDDDSIATIRSSRRISRMYGKATVQDTQVSSKESDAPPSNSQTSDDGSSRQMPTTPPSKLTLTYSSDDLSPIVIQTTPKKKPEAGMPLTSNASESRRAKQYMLTEQLEALLPRSRRPKEIVSMGKKSNRNAHSRGILVDDSDDGSIEEEEVEPLVRANLRKRSATATTQSQMPSRKRQTIAKSRIPVPTRAQGPQKTKTTTVSVIIPSKSSNNIISTKEKENEPSKDDDKSGWSETQMRAHKERIKYFQQIDDFELEVETL